MESTDLEQESRAEQPPAVTPLEWGALAAGVVPAIVAGGWALATGWLPLGDSAQLTVRSRDVLTANHPVVGAWSSSSQGTSSNINNLGPIYNELLAPFTKVSAYAGTAVGMTVITVACVVVTWLAARATLGRRGVVVAMAATTVLITAMGCVTLLQTRQQIALLLPFWALLWTVTSVVAGRSWAVPVAAFLASLLAQTHFSFLFQAVALLGIVTVRLLVSHRRPMASPLRRPLVVTAIVLAASWIQPVIDQAVGSRNLGRVLGGGPGPGPDWQVAANLIAHKGLVPPFWARPLAHAGQQVVVAEGTFASSWLPVLAWAAVLVLALIRTRRRATGAWAVAIVAAVLLPTVLAVAARIPKVLIGFPPQNYYWMWPTSLFLTAALALAILDEVGPLERLVPPRPLVAAAGAVLAAAALVASVPSSRIEEVSSESFAQRDVGRKFVDEVATSLRRHPINGTVVIDYSQDQVLSQHRYAFLAELQRAGVPFTFDGDDPSVFRFGLRRCADGKATTRLYLVSGTSAEAHRPEGARVLARIPIPAGPRRRLRDFDALMGDHLRSGELRLDLKLLRQTDPVLAAKVADILATPGEPATALATKLDFYVDRTDGGTGRAELATVGRWSDLRISVYRDAVRLVAVPQVPGAPIQSCPHR